MALCKLFFEMIPNKTANFVKNINTMQTGYHYNDGWFALTGGWTVILNNNNVTYEYNRKMMYDFYLANN